MAEERCVRRAQTGGNGPQTGRRAQLYGVTRRRQHGGIGFRTEGHPLYATARLWDDGVIDPRQTRSALALALSASLNALIPDYDAPVFRM